MEICFFAAPVTTLLATKLVLIVFLRPKQARVEKKIWALWRLEQHCPAKLDHSFFDLQTCVWPGIIVLYKESSLLFSHNAGNKVLQFGQHFYLTCKIDNCCSFDEMQVNNASCVPEDGAESLLADSCNLNFFTAG